MRDKVVSRGLLRVLDQGRACGDCSACCTHIATDEIGISHEAHRDCRHLAQGRCGIYLGRPKSCADYECLWRLGFGGADDRPDRLGAVFHLVRYQPDGSIFIAANECRPGGLDPSTPGWAAVEEMGFQATVVINRFDGRVQALEPAIPK